MVLSDASISSPRRAPRPRSPSPACTKPQKQTENNSTTGVVHQARKREVSSRYRPASFTSNLSFTASADFSSSSCDSPKKPPSRERRLAGFASPVVSNRHTAVCDAPKRSSSAERRRSSCTDTNAASALSSSNRSSLTALDAAKRAASTECRRASQATGSSSVSLDCSSSASTKRRSSTERRCPSPAESKSTGNSRKPSLSPSRPAWQSSNGMLSSLQAQSAQNLANAKTQSRDQTLRPAAANGVADHRCGDIAERKSTPERKRGVTPERKGSLVRWPSVDQAENARPFENLQMKSIAKCWSSTNNGKFCRSATITSIDLSSDKVALPPRFSAALLMQDQQANASVARASPRGKFSRSLNEGPPSPIFAKKSSPADRGSSPEGRAKEKASILQKAHSASLQQGSVVKMQNSALQQGSLATTQTVSLQQERLDKIQYSPLHQGSLAKMQKPFSHQGSLDKMQRTSMQQENLENCIGLEAQLATSVPHISENRPKENATLLNVNKAASSAKNTVTAACARSPEGGLIPSGSTGDLTCKTSQAITQQGCYKTDRFLIKLSKDKGKLLQHFKPEDSEIRHQSDQIERPINDPLCVESPGHSQPENHLAAQDLLSIASHERCGHLVLPYQGGSSPARMKLSPSPMTANNSFRQKNVNNGMEVTNAKRITANPIEDIRTLRLLQNRLFQWRFINARAEAALSTQKAAAEKVLVNVGLKTFDLQMKVAMLRIKSLKARQIQKLDSLISEQEGLLQEWEAMDQEHVTALEAVTKALESATLKIPVTAGARADVRAIREAIAFVLDVMHSTELPVRSLQPKVERLNILLREVATISASERALIAELEELLSTFASFQMEEHSLNAHTMQCAHEMKQFTEVITSSSELSQ